MNTIKYLIKNINLINNSKKGYVFSIIAIVLGVLLYAFFSAQLNTPNYLEIQDQIDTRIFQLDREFTFFKSSVIQSITRFSLYHATFEFYSILLQDQTIRDSFNKDYENFQNAILTLAIDGTFDGTPVTGMENKTIPHLISYYENFFNSSLFAELEYEILSGRIYEITPLHIISDIEFEISVSSRELDFEIFDRFTVRPSFTVEGFKDPQIALYVDNESAGVLTQERESPVFQGNWTLDLFNDTFRNEYVTTFEFPEFRYTLGTSFIRSILNSTNRGIYRDILSFLSFEYSMNANPYDTANYNYSHNLFGSTVFLNSFDNISQNLDQTSYNFNFNLPVGSDCFVQGISGDSCILNELAKVDDLILDRSQFTMSFWINYSSSQTGSHTLINTSEFSIILDKDEEVLQFQGTLEDGTIFSRNNIVFRSNRWNNLLIGTSQSQGIQLLINSELRYVNPILKKFNLISNIEFGNAHFDEIVFINRTISNREISRLISQRKALFLEYSPSLFNDGLFVYNLGEYIELNLSHRIDDSFSEFAVEFWFRFDNENGNGGDLLILDTSTGSEEFIVGVSSNQISISGESILGNSFSHSSDGTHNFLDNRYKHVVVQKLSSGALQVYLNSNLILDLPVNSINGSLGNFNKARIFGVDSEFYGVIDEFVIYNRTFQEFEIKSHFYNFKSEVGGCCNYFKLFNEDIHGPVSGVRNGLPTIFVSDIEKYNSYDIVLTQRNASEEINGAWEGELFDACQVYVYNMEQYSNVQLVIPGTIGSRCFDLIRLGIY
ncbi:MAG: LamG-like jellyroll fold domain-containing protein [Candidatus Woesearchaeota archaeon]